MGDVQETNSNETTESSVALKADTTAVLAGADKQTDGQTHFGVAVMVSSDGKPSTLMIPDVAGVATGEPVFITKPIRINGENLKTFLKNKGVKLPEALSNLIEDTKISCEAFYYTKDGPLLMMFALKFEEGLITSLTHDEDLGKLFDVKGAAVRVLRCPENAFDILKQYAAGLEG
jgi:hypothetical protein